jgi:hypothetical protein
MGTRSAFIAVAATIAAVIAVAGCSDDTHGETITLKLHEPGHEVGRYAPIGDFSASRYEPGTGYTFAVPLQNPSAAGKYPTPQEKVGEMVLACIAAEPSLESGDPLHGQCTGTVLVDGGTLALSMGGDIGLKVTGTITGGTGKYAGASGTFTWVGRYEKTDTYHITLP